MSTSDRKVKIESLQRADAAIAREGASGETEAIIASSHRAMSRVVRDFTVFEHGMTNAYRVTRYGYGPLPTKHGEFHQLSFRVDDRWQDYHCLVKAEKWTDGFEPVFKCRKGLPLRLDSACVGGMIFGATDCDCHAQLLKAEEEIAHFGEGIIVHIFNQDGRGKGTGFKSATQILQEQLGYDTVKAARTLAGEADIDERSYGGAIAVLRFLLGTQQDIGFRLMSGNPEKISALEGNGFRVKVTPPQVPATPETEHHLRAKARFLHHVVPSITL